MKEGDHFPSGAIDRGFVNQSHFRVRRLAKLASDVVRSKSNVMNAARRIFFQKFGNGTFRARRLEKFKMDSANGKEGGANLLPSNFFAPVAL